MLYTSSRCISNCLYHLLFLSPINSHFSKPTMLFEKYFKINKCYESNMMFSPRKEPNSSPQQAMQGLLTWSLNTCPVILSAAELLHCLGEGNNIPPHPGSAEDPKLKPHLPHVKKEVSDSKMSVIRMTPYVHTMPLFAVHIKVFFIPRKVFFSFFIPGKVFLSWQSTKTVICCKILCRASLFA